MCLICRHTHLRSYVSTHTPILIYTYSHIHAHSHLHTYTPVCAYAHTHTYAHTYFRMRIHTCIYICIPAYTRVCVLAHAHAYAHAYAHACTCPFFVFLEFLMLGHMCPCRPICAHVRMRVPCVTSNIYIYVCILSVIVPTFGVFSWCVLVCLLYVCCTYSLLLIHFYSLFFVCIALISP